MKYFCTLFNHKFLPHGLALHQSMVKHCGDFELFILCVDKDVEDQLRKLDLSGVRLLALTEFETEGLLAIKPGRTLGEYCWTLTPHVFGFVREKFPHVDQLTYLDADLFFFDNPLPFFEEMNRSGRDVMITEHAYAPEYDQSSTSGRFCVQYLTVNFTEAAERVIGWWRERCLEWCFDRVEGGRFGDQKYLDRWPEMFSDSVHILTQKDRTIAPWNIDHVAARDGGLNPVFYHFHGFRITHPRWARCFSEYRISRKNQWVYSEYGKIVKNRLRVMRSAGIPVPSLPVDRPRLALLRYFKWVFVDHTMRWEYLG